jgi:ubiquinone/menaquinone biosynthesis C-methylase UbiE
MKQFSYPPSEWHVRYSIQAVWTQSLRERLYQLSNLRNAERIMEVGSGTGVIISEIADQFQTQTYGLDIDHQANAFSQNHDSKTRYITGDGRNLPFPHAAFDVTLCHFLLMWVPNPEFVIHEMRRVTKDDGWILALAEPDYGGRIDYPPKFDEIGKLQSTSLLDQGADPMIGRRLRSIFTEAGLIEIQVGVLSGEWTGSPNLEELESEWRTITADLRNKLSDEALEEYQKADLEAWRSGSRILFIPTFYAIGRVPSQTD